MARSSIIDYYNHSTQKKHIVVYFKYFQKLKRRSIIFTSAFMLLLGTALLFVVTCTKEYSYEGGNGSNLPNTAVYTTLNPMGTCKGHIFKGNYEVGTPLDTTNQLLIEVTVLDTGSYHLTTQLLNGIWFTASGIFRDTGLYTVKLIGNGIPKQSGTFVFTLNDSIACSYPLNFEPKGTVSSRYQFTGAPGTCAGFLITGKYIAGTALNSSNTISIQANVASIGNYTIHTDTIDGISFIANGTFTHTGLQMIQLNGNGIPLMPDNLLFSIANDSSTCSLPITVNIPDPAAVYVLESGYGTPAPCIYSIAGNYMAGSTLTTSNTVSINAYVTVPGNYAVITDTLNGIRFNYNGTFTTTGAQRIVLQGIGTPFNKGNFQYVPTIIGVHPLGGQACAFTITIQ